MTDAILKKKLLSMVEQYGYKPFTELAFKKWPHMLCHSNAREFRHHFAFSISDDMSDEIKNEKLVSFFMLFILQDHTIEHFAAILARLDILRILSKRFFKFKSWIIGRFVTFGQNILDLDFSKFIQIEYVFEYNEGFKCMKDRDEKVIFNQSWLEHFDHDTLIKISMVKEFDLDDRFWDFEDSNDLFKQQDEDLEPEKDAHLDIICNNQEETNQSQRNGK